MKFAEFEEKVKEVERARAIFRYALDHISKAQVCGCALVTSRPASLGDDVDVTLLRLLNHALLQHAGSRRDLSSRTSQLVLPSNQATSIYARAVAFEKQHGDRAGIEDVIVGERRFQYEDEVRHQKFQSDNKAPMVLFCWTSSLPRMFAAHLVRHIISHAAGGSQSPQLRHLVRLRAAGGKCRRPRQSP